MKKILIAASTFMLMLAVFWLVLRTQTGPESDFYKGQPLSYWMGQLRLGRLHDNEVVTALGTNLIPYAIKALATQESLYSRCSRLYGAKILPAAWVKRLPSGRTRGEAASIRATGALALMVVGATNEPVRSVLDADSLR